MSIPRWDSAGIPDQRGRTAVVTGANSGIGFEAARVLAEKGARVVLACRNAEKAAAACAAIRALAPDADLRTAPLDLADAASVRAAAEVLTRDFDRIDLVINNAGAAFGKLSLVDGVDRTFVTNQLGPFAFTGLLVPRVLAAPAGRIVTVTSGGHEMGRLRLDDLSFVKRRYSRWRAYTQTKLANLLFAVELQRRLAAAGAPAISVAAHPGAASTEFGRNSGGLMSVVSAPPLRLLLAPLVNTAAEGALPTLRAAVDPHVHGGDLYAPAGPHGIKGPPERAGTPAVARDEVAGAALWETCEQLTGVHYPLP